MIKKVLISILLLVLLIAGATIYYLDSIVKNGIEVVGSNILGTGVTVLSVSVSPLNGRGTLRGLSIENPEGFDSDYFLQLDEVVLTMDPGSVFEDVIEIDTITIVRPQITYETRLTTSNIRQLIDNLSAGESAEPSAAALPGQEQTQDSAKRIIVREFRMLDPQLNLVAAVLNAPIPLPDIELNDVGTEDNSVTIAQAIRQVFSSLSASILDANLPSLDDLREGVENRLQETVDDAVEQLGGRLRNILN